MLCGESSERKPAIERSHVSKQSHRLNLLPKFHAGSNAGREGQERTAGAAPLPSRRSAKRPELGTPGVTRTTQKCVI